jgi:GNAT superfamily N-acetyltransferase
LLTVPVIRGLASEDVPQAVELSSGAGWNQTEEDWRTIIELDPDSCFAVDCGGKVAATATLVCYGKSLAWLGMVLTRPEFQRRGFARTLVERALGVADARGIQTVKLDATVHGQPLYESFGFAAEQEIQRWSGWGAKCRGGQVDSSLDWGSFPAERMPLLRALARRARPLGDGNEFVMRRDGLRACYLGPCVAYSRQRAETLIAAALGAVDGPWIWDLFPSHADAVTLATQFGFRPERRLTRMYRGGKSRGDESMVYAIAGFEFGS